MSFLNIFSKNKSFISKFSASLKEVFTSKKIDEEFLEKLEETLILSDMGIKTSLQIIDELRETKFNKDFKEDDIREFLAKKISEILQKCQVNLNKKLQNSPKKPKILIFNGVNGAGKTTTIGKIAFNLSNQGQKVLVAACDTFRAGASSQLEVWAKRSNAEIICATKDGEDPASLAYKAFMKAREENFDFLLIDTAGRLQNKQNLMDELKKIGNVLRKIDENAIDENILILDATIGQNAKNQLEIFDKIAGISGIIVTKLDGSAKGGILVALCAEFQKPIYAIGVGEKIEDLQEFDPDSFAKNLID
jgi:fused signal recognition particle receptor